LRPSLHAFEAFHAIGCLRRKFRAYLFHSLRLTPDTASGIPWQYFLNIFLRKALKKICHGIPEAETL